LAEQSVVENRNKLEAKLKIERQSLQKQKEELEHQLIMVMKNRNDRIEAAKEQQAVLTERKQELKNEMDVKLREHHTCLQQIMQNLAELRSIEGSDVEVSNEKLLKFLSAR
jgi:hypothetical protein